MLSERLEMESEELEEPEELLASRKIEERRQVVKHG